MSYNLHFVGLVCFTRFVAGLDALLPDGRLATAPHFPAIVSVPGAAIEWDWWGTDEEHEKGIFRIDDHAVLEFPGANQPGELNPAQWFFLPNLHGLDKTFKLAETPLTIATARLRNGDFRVREHPHGDAVVSTLSVPHVGVIRVEAGDRFIRFSAGTELALANVGKGYLDPLLVPKAPVAAIVDDDDEEHFQIYNQLDEPPHNRLPVPALTSLPKVPSNHPVFDQRLKMLKIGCSNTGCC
jgi:hypothetical protein